MINLKPKLSDFCLQDVMKTCLRVFQKKQKHTRKSIEEFYELPMHYNLSQVVNNNHSSHFKVKQAAT